MLIFLIYQILSTTIVFYTWLNDNTLLSSYPPTYILLYIKSALMVLFLSLLCNVYLVFPVKLTVMIKGTRLNRKQINISLGFAYTKYKVQEVTFKFTILDLQQKTIKKTLKS